MSHVLSSEHDLEAFHDWVADIGPLAALEHVRAVLNWIDYHVDAEELGLDDLARLRLLVKDLQTDFAGVIGTIDQAIRQHVDVYQTVTVLDGRHTVTVKPTKSGGSTHWAHADVAKALWPLAEGDVDEYVRLIASSLGKAASWKSTDLKKLDIDVRPLRSTTAAVVGTSVVIEKAVTAS